MRRKQRSLNQIKEDISIRVLREKLPKEWVVHSYGNDYGIDCVIELFDFIDKKEIIAETLGENIFVQLKSSSNIEYSTREIYERDNVAKGTLKENKQTSKNIPIAKFQLDITDILTIQSIGIAIPVLLILVDTNTEKAYFVCLNDYIDKVLIPEDPTYATKGSKTIYIPIYNEILNNDYGLIPLRAYGKRSKMYGAFSLFNYQLKELNYIQDRVELNDKVAQQKSLEMIDTFLDILLRQNIWIGHEFWPPMKYKYNQLLELKQKLITGINSKDYEYFLIFCLHEVWGGLTTLESIYEEIFREYFLPTYIDISFNS